MHRTGIDRLFAISRSRDTSRCTRLNPAQPLCETHQYNQQQSHRQNSAAGSSLRSHQRPDLASGGGGEGLPDCDSLIEELIVPPLIFEMSSRPVTLHQHWTVPEKMDRLLKYDFEASQYEKGR